MSPPDAAPRRAADRLLVPVVVVLGIFTLLAITSPEIRFAYRSETTNSALETGSAIIGGLAAFLVGARFRRNYALSDLLLASGLAVLAIVNTTLIVLYTAGADTGPVAAWSMVVLTTAGIGVVASSALIPARRTAHTGENARLAVVVTFAFAALVVIVLALVREALPDVADRRLAAERSAYPNIGVHTSLAIVLALSAALLAVACVAFRRRARETDDELRSWLSLAAAVGAFSQLHYALFPSIYTSLVYTGDALRLGFYALVLVAVLREIAAYQPQLVRAVRFEERRRLASDLHDGLAQELAFIVSSTATLRESLPCDPAVAHLRAAARRALEESRATLTWLSRPAEEPLDALLSDSARELTTRAGMGLELDLAEGVVTDLRTREVLHRILREALTNAIRYSGAPSVRVQLASSREIELAVADDGNGFDPARPRGADGTGYGLQSMRERAEAIGGRLEIDSREGGGTVVRAVLPRG